MERGRTGGNGTNGRQRRRSAREPLDRTGHTARFRHGTATGTTGGVNPYPGGSAGRAPAGGGARLRRHPAALVAIPLASTAMLPADGANGLYGNGPYGQRPGGNWPLWHRSAARQRHRHGRPVSRGRKWTVVGALPGGQNGTCRMVNARTRWPARNRTVSRRRISAWRKHARRSKRERQRDGTGRAPTGRNGLGASRGGPNGYTALAAARRSRRPAGVGPVA